MRILSITLVLSALLIAGCGDANVAKINDQTDISQASYQRLLRSNLALLGGPRSGLLQGPKYQACVASQQSGNQDTRRQLCAQGALLAEQKIFSQMIARYWALAEGETRNIKLSPAELKNKETSLNATYPKIEGGLTSEDIQLFAKAELMAAVISKNNNPSNKEIQDFYLKNKTIFTPAPTRDVNLLLTGNKSKANQARAALEAGKSWNKVYSTYNDSRLWNSPTALVQKTSRSAWLKDLGNAIFGAQINKLIGPVKISALRAFAVIEVQSSKNGGSTPPFSVIKEQVKEAFAAKTLKNNQQTVNSQLVQKWQSKTECYGRYSQWFPCFGQK